MRGRRWKGDEVGGREQWWVRGDEGRGVASVCYNSFGYVSL